MNEIGVDLEESISIKSQVSLLAKFWSICESTQTNAKLLLPDAKEIPFYLLRTNKNNKFSTGKFRNITRDVVENAQSSLSIATSPRRKIKLNALLPPVPVSKGREL
jgi:hypothetical protein